MRRILIVRTSALGDIVHALPALAAVADAFPGAEIDWAVDARYAGLLEFVDGVTTRVVVRPGTRRAIGFMRRRGYDAALDLQGLLKSAVIARLSGARRVIGFARGALREPAAAWCYRERVAVSDRIHVIRKNLAVLAPLGVTAAVDIRFPLRVPSSAVADHVSADARRRGDGGFVVLNPGAAWPNKRWPPARFGALAARIRERHGLPSFVLWGPGEDVLAGAVVAASGGAAARVPATTVGDLLAVTARATLMVSGDTGPAHLAAALQTPLVGLYGPTWPDRNGPWHPDDEVVSRAAVCVCHHKRACQRPPMCVEDIGVDEVAEAVARRLSKAGAR